ncbi:hypothetical protein Pla110_28400 [Polystyrenella longa]|uniref:Protein SlyX n=1 Tax=Polystyrenella longa TaxID=2528007 RepID=A0A518CPG7_9PLAN|nr:SlyX family protein [Polystyrenella longa]QDU81103.1 hypothetical protein Pla110_28400 [Polystyrenella longa]
MSPPDTEALLLRITDLEMLFTHLQHDVQQLNGVVLEQQSQLDDLRHINEKLQQHIEEIEGTEERNPSDERPPHY